MTMTYFGRVSTLLFFLATAISCANNGYLQLEASAVECTMPRPAVCTMDYTPVCATLTGGDAATTYANGCGACSDTTVISYVAGECK